MHTKIYGKHVFECDACGETLETDTADFAEALRIMRTDNNWRSERVGQDWVHTCFGCKDPEDKNARAKRVGRIP